MRLDRLHATIGRNDFRTVLLPVWCKGEKDWWVGLSLWRNAHPDFHSLDSSHRSYNS